MELIQTSMLTNEISVVTGKQHKNVLADCRNMFQELDIQPAEISARYDSEYKDGKGEMRPCYKLDKKLTLCLVAKYDTRTRMAIIERWDDLEQAGSKLINDLQNNTSPIVLRKMADITEERDFLAIENKELKPLADFARSFAHCIGNYLIRDFAKMISNNSGIKIGQNELFQWLYDNRYLIEHGRSRKMPYQKYINNNYFKVKTSVWQGNTQDHPSITTTITPKGMAALGPKIIRQYRITLDEKGA